MPWCNWSITSYSGINAEHSRKPERQKKNQQLQLGQSKPGKGLLNTKKSEAKRFLFLVQKRSELVFLLAPMSMVELMSRNGQLTSRKLTAEPWKNLKERHPV